MRNTAIKTLFFFCLVFMPCVLHAQDAAGGSRAVFNAALDRSYNKEYDAASELFKKYIVLEPDDPAGYWRLIYTQFFNLRLLQGKEFPEVDGKTFSEAEYRGFMDLISTGLAKTEAKIVGGDNESCRPHYLETDDPQPCSSFYLYVKAGIISTHGGLKVENTGKWGWWNARNSLKEAIAIAWTSQYRDAKYFIGLTNYNGSRHPKAFFFAGLPRDKATGLNMIYESVIQNKGPFVDDIWFVIFSIQTDEDNKGQYAPELVHRLFEYLFSKYPRNGTLQEYRERH